MDKLKPAKPFALEEEGNIPEKWKTWKSDLNLYLQATEAHTKENLIKSSILLHCIGKPGYDIYSTFVFEDDAQKMNYDVVINKFDEYFKPKKNVTIQRFKFLTARQDDDESFDNFVTRVRRLSEECEFGNQVQNPLIKDIIIIGIRDKKLQEALLKDGDIDLNKVIKQGRAREAAKLHVKDMNKSRTSEKATVDRLQAFNTAYITNCKYCRGNHKKGSCPAYGRQCHNCQRIGHFSKSCKQKRKTTVKRKITQHL